MLPLVVMDVPLSCVNSAAIQSHIPAKLIIAVLQTERGKTGKVTYNKNGTYDIGAMAINSTWLPELKKHGVIEKDIQFDACANVFAGSWILSKKIAAENQLATGIGDYHSHTTLLNKNYYQKITVFLNAIPFES